MKLNRALALITGLIAAGVLIAVLLAGWYLMRAPFPPFPPPIFLHHLDVVRADTAAPFSRWTKVGTFPTLWECEAHRDSQPWERCVSAIDPRLWR